MKQYTPNEGIRDEDRKKKEREYRSKMYWSPLNILSCVLIIMVIVPIIIAILK